MYTLLSIILSSKTNFPATSADLHPQIMTPPPLCFMVVLGTFLIFIRSMCSNKLFILYLNIRMKNKIIQHPAQAISVKGTEVYVYVLILMYVLMYSDIHKYVYNSYIIVIAIKLLVKEI